MATAAAVIMDDCYNRYSKARRWVLIIGVLAVVFMVYQSASLSFAQTDYENAVHYIIDQDPQAVIVSTQPLVEGLYMADDKRIVPCPNDVFSLVSLYKKGAKYLIIDPQAYISWTVNGRRFSPPLDDFLEIMLKNVSPIKTFPHLNSVLLNRFVLDHNEQILDSLSFITHAKANEYGKIRVYDLGVVLSTLQHTLSAS